MLPLRRNNRQELLGGRYCRWRGAPPETKLDTLAWYRNKYLPGNFPNSKEANKFNFLRICRIRLIIVRSKKAVQSHDSFKMDGEGTREVSTFDDPGRERRLLRRRFSVCWKRTKRISAAGFPVRSD